VPVSYAAAFVAGLVTFLSPCMLPLLPVYLSFITGMSAAELRDSSRKTSEVLVPILLFVLGFTVVFVALGASASALGTILIAWKPIIERVAGVVAIVLGVLLLDLIPLPFLHGAPLVDPAIVRRFGGAAAFVLGLVFPFAIGPCSGPVYGAIVLMAADARSLAGGAGLLLVYSAGLAVPFVVFGLLFGTLAGRLAFLNRHARTVNRVAGVILILFGLLVATNTLQYLEAVAGQAMPFLTPLTSRFG
jgi:cytochrome c-type biogenesis protein